MDAQTPPQETPGRDLAIAAEALYLSNLLLLPGISFLMLVWLYWKKAPTAPPLAACHIRQTLSASIWAGMLIVLVTSLIAIMANLDRSYTWVALILYFTICHTTLIVLGMFGLARAMAGRNFRYPLIGLANCRIS